MTKIPLAELEAYFKSVDLPKEIRVNDWTYIFDVPKMIEGHMSICKSENGKNYRFEVYYDRLIELKNKLESINNH